jgi:hypothetical protein
VDLAACPLTTCQTALSIMRLPPGRGSTAGWACQTVVLPNSLRPSCLSSCVLTVLRAHGSARLRRYPNYYGLDSNDSGDLNAPGDFIQLLSDQADL